MYLGGILGGVAAIITAIGGLRAPSSSKPQAPAPDISQTRGRNAGHRRQEEAATS